MFSHLPLVKERKKREADNRSLCVIWLTQRITLTRFSFLVKLTEKSFIMKKIATLNAQNISVEYNLIDNLLCEKFQ